MGDLAETLPLFLLLGLAIALLTDWLAGRLHYGPSSSAWSLTAVLARLVWAAILAAGAFIAVRYSERLARPGIGYAAFGLVGIALSLTRAILFRHAQAQTPKLTLDTFQILALTLHNATYVLLAATFYLVLALLARQAVQPLLLLPLAVGALLPDLDSQSSLPGRLLPFVSRRLEARLGHRGKWHSLGINAAIAILTLPLLLISGWLLWAAISLGFLAHLLVDLLDREGLTIFWPLSHTRYFLGSPRTRAGSSVRHRLAMALLALIVILAYAGIRYAPQPPPAPIPSYDDTVDRYYGLRGRVLVFADVEGTWQMTGQRIYGRFEILNAVGRSLVMLDRYTGAVFSAGRDPTDNMYVNGIALAPGSEAHIKPVELRLEKQRLAEALPVIYTMQQEPGLQHIFVSGEIVLAESAAVDVGSITLDNSQTQLRKIAADTSGHFTFRYLTASELIGLANVEVEAADLVIVATSTGAETTATATPLPSPPPATEDHP